MKKSVSKEVLKQRIKERKENPILPDPKTPQGHKAIINQAEIIEPKYMMGTDAYHQLGPISRNEYNLCSVSKQTDDYYIGSWVTGFGFFDILFPKSTTRLLTEEEIEKYNNTYVSIGSQPSFKLKVD